MIRSDIHSDRIYYNENYPLRLNFTRLTKERPNVSSSVYSRSLPMAIPLARVLTVISSRRGSFLKM